jgi:hypothetical protein
MVSTNALRPFLLLLMTRDALPFESQYTKLSISDIVRHSKKFHRERGEVHGKLVINGELSYLEDGSSCGKPSVPCKLSTRFEICRVTAGVRIGSDCSEILFRLFQSKKEKNKAGPIVIENVVLRGVLFTTREDLTYDTSNGPVPKVGFGHLGILPAEIRVVEMEVVE